MNIISILLYITFITGPLCIYTSAILAIVEKTTHNETINFITNCVFITGCLLILTAVSIVSTQRLRNQETTPLLIAT